MEKYLSRKFIAYGVTIASALLVYLNGDISGTAFLASVTTATGVYVGAQGYVDAKQGQ